ncbi:MAG: glycoside hydrolase family 31 protein [Alphaproteobacteria bacterium]
MSSDPFLPAIPDWGAMPAPALGDGRIDDDGALTVATAFGPMTVRGFAPGIVRLTIEAAAPLPDYAILVAEAEPGASRIAAGADGWTVAAGDAALTVARDSGRLALARDGAPVLASADDGHFARRYRLPALSRTDDGWVLAFALASDTAVYGLGEKWGPLNRRGQLVVSRNEDALGVNAEKSYKNTPFAWSPDGWGLFVHTPADVVHGVGYAPWSHRSYVLQVREPRLDLFLIAGRDGAAILARYTALTGRMQPLPEWSFGIWVSRAYYRTPAEMLEVARGLRAAQVPADVINLDGRAWQDTPTRFAFEWDPARFDDPAAVCAAVHDLGFRLCLWEYPLVSTANALFDELAGNGWLLVDADGRTAEYAFSSEPFGKVLTQLPVSGLVDFTHPDAFADWRDRHAALFAAGADVIKSDFGEQVEDRMRAANGDDGRRLHNVYALLYNRCVHEATVAARGTDDAMVFGRAGWAGSQRYPIQWGGDPQADWEGLAASIRGGLSWGMSGGACYATDIGGFYGGDPEPALQVRWTQAAVFASHMRFHGIGPREPHLIPGEAGDIVRAFCRLRYRLIPYLRGAVEDARRTGLPVMRAMALAFPDQPLAWPFDLQFLCGPDLLVMPVTSPDGRMRGYLPQGRWRDFRTGAAVDGGRLHEATVPLDTLPVFVRDGAVLALGPEVQHTGALAGRPRVDEVRLYGQPRFQPCAAGTDLRLEDGRPVGADGGRVVAFGA